MLYKYWKEAPNRISEQERRNFYAHHDRHPGRRSARHGQPRVQRSVDPLRVVGVVLRPPERGRPAAARQTCPARSATSRCARPRATLRQPVAARLRHGPTTPRASCRRRSTSMIELLQRSRDPRRLRRTRHVAGDRPGRDARARRRPDQLALPHAGDLRHDHHRLARQQRRSGSTRRPAASSTSTRCASPIRRSRTTRRPANPTDYDLVNACELWLADTATSDSEVEELSQPRKRRR